MPHIMTKKAEKAMKVLVTGSHGVLGSAFVGVLKKRGISYVPYNRAHPKSTARDITAVVHFGGITPHSLVRGKAPSSAAYHAANVTGTAALLAALSRMKKLTRFVNVGSASEYGFSKRPFRENSKGHPEGAYGQSKLAQSILVEAFARTHGVRTFNLRIFNVMGFVTRRPIEGFVSDRPNIFTALTDQFKKRPPRVIEVSNAKDVRDFVAMEDVLEAIERALTANSGGVYELVNICSGHGTPISYIVELFSKALHLPYTLKNLSRKKRLSIGVIGKAERLLGWRAKRPLERAVRKYLEL